MDALETLKTRRSFRAYKEEMPSRELLEQVCEAGTFAPTGAGSQSPVMVVVQDKKTRDELSEMNREILGWDKDPFYGAPCIIVVLADKTAPTPLEDGSLVLGNLMNAAHAVGLGSCWIHRARQMFDSERGKELLKQWGIDGDYVGVGNLAIGYPACPAPEPKPRKDGYVRFV
ncbi:MAG: nitroreductase [Bacteroidales bacterium]|nr:nitroreductase [Bacteroidales bacterium]